jgi:hypothetical protein
LGVDNWSGHHVLLSSNELLFLQRHSPSVVPGNWIWRRWMLGIYTDHSLHVRVVC